MKLSYLDNQDSNLIITLQGDMDASGCAKLRPQLEQLVDDQQHINIELDFSQVGFLDSSGIGVIVFLYKRLTSQGRKLQLTHVCGQPQELMQLLRIDQAIPVSMEESSVLSGTAG